MPSVDQPISMLKLAAPKTYVLIFNSIQIISPSEENDLFFSHQMRGMVNTTGQFKLQTESLNENQDWAEEALKDQLRGTHPKAYQCHCRISLMNTVTVQLVHTFQLHHQFQPLSCDHWNIFALTQHQHHQQLRFNSLDISKCLQYQRCGHVESFPCKWNQNSDYFHLNRLSFRTLFKLFMYIEKIFQ